MRVAVLVALLAPEGANEQTSPDEFVLSAFNDNGFKNSFKSIGGAVLPSGCLYEGAWYRNGARVSTGEACLRCACGAGALTCRRRACAPPPEPPPPRCHTLHRRGACCPELHCPDGVKLMEHGASARYENDDSDLSGPASLTHACVEGGTVYAAGSAMKSSVACEQCFCLGGARRCVRPRCLPPPPGCKPRPAPGACCPQRYYCEHRSNKPPEERHPHDCKVDGKWVVEGERVVSSMSGAMNCTQCFCLRGSVQCQPLSCAPPLLGCKPLLRSGECCAHQYVCDRSSQGSSESRILTLSSVVHTSARNNNQIPKTSSTDTTIKTTLASVYNLKNTQTSATKNHLISTTKVKRKTSDPPPETSSQSTQNVTVEDKTTTTSTKEPITSTTVVSPKITTTEEPSTTEFTTEMTSTEQPEGSVRIMINGTINCTAELSSTSLPLNITSNDTDKIKMESLPRIPLIDVSNLEDHTFAANEIITDRTINGDFDENESFVINVTSSLFTNTSKTTTKAPPPTVTKISLPTDIGGALNSSKKTKGDYDFDYTQPTLPPSLPNLKIIPFVAADAVVEDDHAKEPLTYPMLEREDKFPVYYPTADSKNTAYANRREDTYHSTQYPVFITDKPEEYPSIAQDIDITSTGYSNSQPELGTSINEYTVSASLGNQIMDTKKAVTLQPPVTTTFKLETPAVNLFSPPVETEGGFIPKGPGIIDEYYAVFPSTPSGPAVPHLTTSMQLDVVKGDCLASDGRRVADGDTISFSCSECRCAWSELHCAPRPCHTPPGCRRRPATTGTGDLCCGDLICDQDKTTKTPEVTTRKQIEANVTESKTPHITPTAPTQPENKTTIGSTLVKIDVPIIKHNKTNNTNEKRVNQHNNVTEKIVKATTTTERTTTRQEMPITTPIPVHKEPVNQNNSAEYDNEDEDEGFSFGSVLKLLLSDSYDTTTAAPRKPTTKIPRTTTKRPRPPLAPTAPKPTVASFVPIPPYIPPKISHNPINRIDHLVLGESTAIKKTTMKPVPTTVRPTTVRQTTMRPTTKAPRPTEVTILEKTTSEGPRPPGPTGLSGAGPGLLKLAGCNIYGRMYRVGRIIAELSTPCQECWCTELGVQCKQLKC